MIKDARGQSLIGESRFIDLGSDLSVRTPAQTRIVKSSDPISKSKLVSKISTALARAPSHRGYTAVPYQLNLLSSVKLREPHSAAKRRNATYAVRAKSKGQRAASR